MKISSSFLLSLLFGASVLLPSFAFAASSTPVFDGSCMAQAVTKRDTAISAALSPVVTAMQTRSTALSSAWNISDVTQRKAALKAAATAFKGTWKTFNTARKQAWKQYATDAKACKANPSDASTTTPPVTNDL